MNERDWKIVLSINLSICIPFFLDGGGFIKKN